MYERIIRVEGSARERGVQIGQQLKDAIQTNYLNQTRFYRDTEGYDYQAWCQCSKKYLPFLQKYAPQVLEELEGMAQGSGLAMEQILAMTTAYEKSFGCQDMGDKCTAFLAMGKATQNGSVLCGQTNDERLDEWLHELDVVIHHLDPESGLEVLTYTHPGIPAYMGMNNAGLAVLWTYIDNGQKQDGVPTNVIIRQLLSCTTLEEGVAYLQSIPHAIPNHFALAHRTQGIVCVECFPNAVYVQRGEDYLVHANHNLFCPQEKEETCSWSTRQRCQQMERLVKEQYGKITPEVAEDFFRSHDGFPYSICVHPNPNKPLGKTLAAMVYDLEQGEMHIAFGNPCEMPYHRYRFDRYPVVEEK